MREALSMEALRSIYSHIAKRYDFQHGLITAKADQRGRKLLINHAVGVGDNVLDCGAGTGTTGLMAAKKVGAKGHVTLFDLSEEMLAIADEKRKQSGLQNIISLQAGDLLHLPYGDNYFDVVLSTYSLCPVYDPGQGALELYRVTKPGGRIGIAHSTEPDNRLLHWLADRVENMAWRMPWLSMGCRAVNVLPVLEKAGGRIVFSKHIGVPLWPFFVFIVEKPNP